MQENIIPGNNQEIIIPDYMQEIIIHDNKQENFIPDNEQENIISSQSLNLGGRRGTTDDIATVPFHHSLSSAGPRESPNPIPVHSLV